MLTALLCIAGPLTLPLGPVPLSLASAVLMLMALLLGPGQTVLCCCVYLAMGLTGLPVFSGFMGGWAALAGPTGGFLLGYLPLALLGGWACTEADRPLLQGIGFIGGTALLYVCGTVWYVWRTGTALWPAVLVCVLPFIPGDAVKIAAVLTGGNRLRSRLRKAGFLR